MTAKITFFPVGNGDMTLIRLANDPPTIILVDISIRQASESDDESVCNVVEELHDRLTLDDDSRPYVDVFMLTHPDEDHCRGAEQYLHLKSVDEYNDEPSDGDRKKIVVRELWTSPRVFRRASGHNTLCDDAKTINKEAKRRVACFRENSDEAKTAGNSIRIIGDDEDGKTEDIQEIVRLPDSVIREIVGAKSELFECRILAPRHEDTDEDEEVRSKNNSSIIAQFLVRAAEQTDGALLLLGGDAEVEIWEDLYDNYHPCDDALEYDLLVTPHHCSWHALSDDSWSEKGRDGELSRKAVWALSRNRDGAKIIATSKPISDDDSDPPCIGAKETYRDMLDDPDADFYCTGEHPEDRKSVV